MEYFKTPDRIHLKKLLTEYKDVLLSRASLLQRNQDLRWTKKRQFDEFWMNIFVRLQNADLRMLLSNYLENQNWWATILNKAGVIINLYDTLFSLSLFLSFATKNTVVSTENFQGWNLIWHASQLHHLPSRLRNIITFIISSIAFPNLVIVIAMVVKKSPWRFSKVWAAGRCFDIAERFPLETAPARTLCRLPGLETISMISCWWGSSTCIGKLTGVWWFGKIEALDRGCLGAAGSGQTLGRSTPGWAILLTVLTIPTHTQYPDTISTVHACT